jgi:hypothetical protein
VSVDLKEICRQVMEKERLRSMSASTQATILNDALPAMPDERGKVHRIVWRATPDGRLEKLTVPWAPPTVTEISNSEALPVILKYEWLRSMPATILSYGLKYDGDDLIGVACFGKGGSTEARNICGKDLVPQTLGLLRGACVHYAPPNSASFLISRACKLAHKDHGYSIFFAYADPAAGELGSIYQNLSWKYIGKPKAGVHTNFISPDGETVISNYDLKDETFSNLGWNPFSGESKYEFLLNRGWTRREQTVKHKYIWFEGTPSERKHLKSLCRFPFLDYPKERGK